MTKLLQISHHTRRAPIDPYAEIRAATTDRLRLEVLFARLERELSRLVEDAVAGEVS